MNTHGFIKRIYDQVHTACKNFLSYRLNSLLKERLRNSFIMGKNKPKDQQPSDNKLVFNNEIENGNMELAVKVTDTQYDLYLKIDTNTHGHQNWFHF